MLTTLAFISLWASALLYFALFKSRLRWASWGSTAVTIASWGLVTASLVVRSMRAGHWPLTTRYEFAWCLVWATVSVYLLLEFSTRDKSGGLFVLLLAASIASYAISLPANDKIVTPLLPALNSPWLVIHVLSAVVAYGAFTVTAGLGLGKLLHHPAAADQSNLDGLQRSMLRSINLGFLWLTFSILTGAIWAQFAWGRYWGWDPKESWTLIIWLWYLLILHLRPLPKWQGRRLAVLSVIGFGLLFFTFVGMPWLIRVVRLESLHSF